MKMQKPVKSVPWPVLLVLALSLAGQAMWKLSRPPAAPQVEDFPAPPSSALMRVASLGDPIPLAKLLMLYLQSFDSQPGNIVAYRKLNYAHLEKWLTLLLELDPVGQYPLYAASRFYAEVPDAAKQQRMMALTYREFLVDPQRRWPWLAYLTLVAQHRLKDLPLAKTYAQAIYEKAKGEDVPLWVKLLEPAILEDMGDWEAARAILQDAMNQGMVKTPDDLRAFQNHLRWLDQKKAKEAGPVR